MAWALSRCLTLFDKCGLLLTEAEAAEAQGYGFQFLRDYSRLASDALLSLRCAYKFRPKFHYFWHLLHELPVTLENPRRQDLFGAEDFVGRVKKVACKCHRGTAHLNVIRRVLLILSHRWDKRRKGLPVTG